MNSFTEEDEIVRGFCISILGELLANFKKYNISFLELRKISNALFVLSKYPEEICNGSIEICASTRSNERMDFAQIDILTDYFELSLGGSIYTEGIGSDTFSKTIYSSTNGFEGNIAEWRDSFNFHKHNLHIIDDSNIQINSSINNIYEKITSELADCYVKKTVTRTISALQKDKTKLSGEDSGLENLWDEICVQVQNQHSGSWGLYEDHVYNYVSGYVNQLAPFEKSAIWLLTENGENWHYGNMQNEETLNPTMVIFNEEDVVEYITNQILYSEAENWTNKKIRAFLEHQIEFD